VVDPSHPGFVVLQQRMRVLENDLQRVCAITNNLPGTSDYRRLLEELEVQKTVNQANGRRLRALESELESLRKKCSQHQVAPPAPAAPPAPPAGFIPFLHS